VLNDTLPSLGDYDSSEETNMSDTGVLIETIPAFFLPLLPLLPREFTHSKSEAKKEE
jgi:hypothetical protein